MTITFLGIGDGYKRWLAGNNSLDGENLIGSTLDNFQKGNYAFSNFYATIKIHLSVMKSISSAVKQAKSEWQT